MLSALVLAETALNGPGTQIVVSLLMEWCCELKVNRYISESRLWCFKKPRSNSRYVSNY